jgi:four helix bundle protein
MALAKEVHRLAGEMRGRDRAPLADQMRRAAISIPANIAEGNGRSSRADYVRFLWIAAGSLAELETHLELARELQLLSPASLIPAQGLLRETGKLLTRLIQALRQREASVP